MNAFLTAYIEAALWSSADDNGDPLDGLYSIDDLAPETLETMRSDCADFQESCAELMEGLDDTQCGHDFWLTRNGHGAGFWDRGLGDIGKELTDMSRPYSECNLYVGDNGLIYC